LYAQAGIPEYWLLNIPDDVLEVRTDPADGEYRETRIYRRGQTIAPLRLPNVVFTIDELLG
jgi:Uma2 family endonuclease